MLLLKLTITGTVQVVHVLVMVNQFVVMVTAQVMKPMKTAQMIVYLQANVQMDR